jgi:hypothetical protein
MAEFRSQWAPAPGNVGAQFFLKLFSWGPSSWASSLPAHVGIVRPDDYALAKSVVVSYASPPPSVSSPHFFPARAIPSKRFANQ